MLQAGVRSGSSSRQDHGGWRPGLPAASPPWSRWPRARPTWRPGAAGGQTRVQRPSRTTSLCSSTACWSSSQAAGGSSHLAVEVPLTEGHLCISTAYVPSFLLLMIALKPASYVWIRGLKDSAVF